MALKDLDYGIDFEVNTGALGQLNKYEQQIDSGFKQISNSVNNADKGMDKFSGNTRGAKTATDQLAGALNSVKNIAVAVGAIEIFKKGVDVGKSFLEKTLGTAGQTEQYTASFKVLTGSMEQAQGVMKQLYTFADKTPFERKGVIEGAQMLMATNLGSMKWLKDAGNLAAGMGKPIEQAAEALGRINVGDFGEGFQAIRQQFKISQQMLEGEGLKFDKSNSYVGSSKEAMEALHRIITSKLGNAMDEQGQTLFGRLSTLKDGVTGVFDTIGTKALPGVKTALDRVMTSVDTVTKSTGFDNFTNSVAKDIDVLIDNASKGADNILKYFNGLFDDVDFQNAPLDQKILKVANDAMSQVKIWWDSSGKNVVSGITQESTKVITSVLTSDEFTQGVATASMQIGKTMGTSILKGLGETYNSSNLFKSIVNAFPGGEGFVKALNPKANTQINSKGDLMDFIANPDRDWTKFILKGEIDDYTNKTIPGEFQKSTGLNSNPYFFDNNIDKAQIGADSLISPTASGNVLKYASGGIATRPSIFGDAGPEMAIPLDGSQRSVSLLNQTADILGVEQPVFNQNRIFNSGSSSSVQITMSPPVFNITIEGNSNGIGTANEVMNVIKPQLNDWWDEKFSDLTVVLKGLSFVQ